MTNRQDIKTKAVNEKSILLNDSENNDIFNCLGKSCLVSINDRTVHARYLHVDLPKRN